MSNFVINTWLCPNCGEEISFDVPTCSYCQHKLHATDQENQEKNHSDRIKTHLFRRLIPGNGKISIRLGLPGWKILRNRLENIKLRKKRSRKKLANILTRHGKNKVGNRGKPTQSPELQSTSKALSEQSINPPAPPYWILKYLSVLAIMLILILSALKNQYTAHITRSLLGKIQFISNVSAAMPAPAPTPSPTPEIKCIPWDKVTDEHLNQIICVYGIVIKYSKNNENNFVIQFSQVISDFKLFDDEREYDLSIGDCVHTEGLVENWPTPSNLAIELSGKLKIDYADACK